MASKRRTADDVYPDRAPGPGGHLKNWVGERFPAYSPDLNGPIEKSWRECQRRVLARAQQITSRELMVQAIKEEWAGLEFEPTERWCGINDLVSRFEDTLDAIVDEEGYDTWYMKH